MAVLQIYAETAKFKNLNFDIAVLQIDAETTKISKDVTLAWLFCKFM